MCKATLLELAPTGTVLSAKVEPRILLEEAALSSNATHRTSEANFFDRVLMQGDSPQTLTTLSVKLTPLNATTRSWCKCTADRMTEGGTHR